MNPEVENLVIEEIIDEVESMTTVNDVVKYLNDRIQYNNDGLELEETISAMSNEDVVFEGELN